MRSGADWLPLLGGVDVLADHLQQRCPFDRLDQVGDGPEGEGRIAVLLSRQSGQKHDGHVRQRRVALQLGADVVTADAGHLDVQHDQLRRDVLQFVQRHLAGGCRLDRVACIDERFCKHREAYRFIVDTQNEALAHTAKYSRCGGALQVAYRGVPYPPPPGVSMRKR